MIVTVRLFAAARQLVGSESIEVSLTSPATVSDLKQKLGQQFPPLQQLLAQTRCAVESAYVADNTQLRDGQEVACIPPVSGG